MDALRHSETFEKFLLPVATSLLALHSMLLLVSGVGHVLRQRMSPAPIEAGDLALSAVLVLLGLLMFVTFRVVEDRDDRTASAPSRLMVHLGTLFEAVLALVFLATIISSPADPVSEFILALVAASGLFTSGVLIIGNDLISKRA